MEQIRRIYIIVVIIITSLLVGYWIVFPDLNQFIETGTNTIVFKSAQTNNDTTLLGIKYVESSNMINDNDQITQILIADDVGIKKIPVASGRNDKNNSNTSSCPSIILERLGLYNKTKILNATTEKTIPTGLERVVLLTAANYQFRDFLRNWELFSESHGLQWVTLALDDEVYFNITKKDSIRLPYEKQVTGKVGGFRTASYNKLVCNKIRMVLQILENCVDTTVVFSDVDNVFLKDPFQHDLGKMLASKRFDYIYQVNVQEILEPRMDPCVKEGVSVIKGKTGFHAGNTGFHALRSTSNTKDLLRETLERCDARKNKIDDQTLLWKVLEERNETWKHCTAMTGLQQDGKESKEAGPSKSSSGIQNDSTITEQEMESNSQLSQYCCLDPYFYRTGQRYVPKTDSGELITYHANFEGSKKKKLKQVDGWHLPKEVEEDPNLVYVGCFEFDCYRAISPRLFPPHIRGTNFKKVVKEILRNATLVPAEG